MGTQRLQIIDRTCKPQAIVGYAIICIVMSMMMSIPVESQETARPIKSIFGIYGQPTAGHNSIRVTEGDEGRIGVKLKLYYSNGHTCQMDKFGEWREDHVAIVAEGLDANQPCKLNLFFENGRVLMKDEGLRCTPVYCGTRGKLDNTSLPKFNPHGK
jgi:hypothetical protein